ncbi:MAG: helix-turn-helix domain-containing protein [Treponema sp.]|uniref:helix-turn-helix transcriptional regulator n=1 Tax=Treponema sp. TaxID=166 RepID=UPI00298DE6EB|nr:helix-turn-helix transcriptional regulator [Treponema sp.]MCQ2602275.1 helix-turn-helix domain-containing protein [Treponema sp.]
MKETLKKLRTENRYSQDLLAKILGISRLSYMKYESGEVEPPVEIVRKLAKIYKVSYKTLIDNELNSEHKSALYSNSAPHSYSYEVASPVPSYGFSENAAMSSNMVAQFAQILATLQSTITNLQEQLNSLKFSDATPATTGYNKSAGFNKTNFFAQIGSVQIDSAYIEELRGASLI